MELCLKKLMTFYLVDSWNYFYQESQRWQITILILNAECWGGGRCPCLSLSNNTNYRPPPAPRPPRHVRIWSILDAESVTTSATVLVSSSQQKYKYKCLVNISTGFYKGLLTFLFYIFPSRRNSFNLYNYPTLITAKKISLNKPLYHCGLWRNR